MPKVKAAKKGKKGSKKAPKAKAKPAQEAAEKEPVEEEEEEEEAEAEEETAGAEEIAEASVEKPRKSKANRLKEALEADDQEEEEEEKEPKGVVYLGHIPHGFFEPQMRMYFSQFGHVTRMRLARSRKTGGSKGYAFIEFKQESVAKIVASTMNKYLLFDKCLVCEFLPRERCHKKMFVGWKRPPKDDRKERREKEMLQHNDRPMVEVDGQSVPQLTERQVSRRERQKRKLKEKLASLEVDFDVDEVLKDGGTADDEAEEPELEEKVPPPAKKKPKKKPRKQEAA